MTGRDDVEIAQIAQILMMLPDSTRDGAKKGKEVKVNVEAKKVEGEGNAKSLRKARSLRHKAKSRPNANEARYITGLAVVACGPESRASRVKRRRQEYSLRRFIRMCIADFEALHY